LGFIQIFCNSYTRYEETNEVNNKHFKKLSQTISYLPHFVSWVVVAGLAYKILDPSTGIVAVISLKLGLEPIAYLRDSRYFWNVMVFSGIWKDLGWNSIIFLAAITGIDSSIYEAATIDGANRRQQIFSITLPNLFPIIALMFIFTIAKIFGGAGGGAGISGITFDSIYNMSNPLVMNKGLVVDYFIYLEGIRAGHYAYSSAAGLILSNISFIILLVANKISKKINGQGAF
jgi:putative aldouronate transport system permease protein